MEYISIDSPIQLCTSVFLEFDFLFDKLTRIYTTIKSSTPINYGLTFILRIMMSILQLISLDAGGTIYISAIVSDGNRA
ncbi:unnamed protein product [Rotaria sp. Silwood1]|nr:unnamed protein product [Rotaria sp. Silwood1]